MRVWVLLAVLTAMPACTSMLVGNAQTGERPTADSRSDAAVAADQAISGEIRQQLSADPLVRDYAVGLRTTAGVVTLTGTVGSFDARDRAVQIATDTAGVSEVRNRIAVNTNL